MNLEIYQSIAEREMRQPAGDCCTAHMERTGEIVPAVNIGLCERCLKGKPINAKVERVCDWKVIPCKSRDMSKRYREFLSALPRKGEVGWDIPEGKTGRDIARPMRMAAKQINIRIVCRTHHGENKLYVQRASPARRESYERSCNEG